MLFALLPLARSRFPVAAAALMAMGGHTLAAPAQLYNKTISVSFSVSIEGKGSDGSTVNHPRQSSRLIYVSSQGRVFSRALRSNGRNSETKERGPGEGGLQFAGNQLVGTLPFISGASRLTISFDPSFQSCSGQIIQGTESGKPFIWKGLNGVTYTATGKPNVSGVSCSIRDGNALAE